jgi:hypothetical protein
MSPKDKKATATKATNDPSPPVTRRTPIPARSPIDDGTRTQLVTLSSQRRRSGSPLLAGLPDRTPKKRKAKESPVSTIESAPVSSISDLGNRLEHAVDDRHQLTRFSKTPPKEHIEQGGDKGPSSKETDIEADKGPSSVRKDKLDPASGIETLALLTLPPLERMQAKAQEATQIGEILKMVSLRKIVRKLTLPLTSLRSISITVAKMRSQIIKRTLTFRRQLECLPLHVVMDLD